MATMLSSIVSWRERHQTRQMAERVETEDTDDNNNNSNNSNRTRDHPLVTTVVSDDDEVNSITEDDDGEEGEFVGSSSSSSRQTTSVGRGSRRNNTDAAEEEGSDADDDSDNFEDEELGVVTTTDAGTTTRTSVRFSGTRRRSTGRRAIRRADLEEERELVRRRTSACVLLSSFVLLRLWIQAVVSGDFGLLLLCLVFTSWTARFIRHTREREETLDRMIDQWDQGESDEVNDARIRRMSFQSQLALAIMQSQLQMMNGGHGHPDGGNDTPGVSDEAKARWDRFDYQSSAGFLKSKMKDEEIDKDSSESSDDEPHCSICLGEYEDGEKLVMLPCKHVYHGDCIEAWCQNHTRCPLCNTDLESAAAGDDVV